MKNWIIFGFLALVSIAAVAAATWIARDGAAATEDADMVVFKNPTCGCCEKWIAHIRASGYTVDAQDVTHRELSKKKQESGLEDTMKSCHTAFIDGYVIEGHVPAADIKRLLKERPDVAGLAVPGMPIGSPGMERDGKTIAYDVLAFRNDGNTQIFASYGE